MTVLGSPRAAAHRCGNCAMWQVRPGGLTGICEVGDLQPLQGFDGNGVDTDEGFRTTPDTFCDCQVPIPPPGPPCPKCGAPLVQGYGLAGGGCGAYEFCEADGCDHFEKWQDPEMMDGATPEDVTQPGASPAREGEAVSTAKPTEPKDRALLHQGETP